MNLTTATPVEIDTELARLYAEEGKLRGRRDLIINDLHRVAGDKQRGSGRSKYWIMTLSEALDGARQTATKADHTGSNAQRSLNSFHEVTAALADNEREANPFHAEYNRRPWSRFFLVTSSNGHIHSSMNCSTCKPRTTYGWYPEFSGQTMADAIAQWDKRGSAEILCTTCFPDAPSARTQRPVDADQCPGSGTLDYPRETARLGYYSGNFGVCRHCSQSITVSKLGRMRKHKEA